MKKTKQSDEDRFETWAIVEIFGHQTFVGLVSEQSIGGCAFVRLDVPELPAIDDYPKCPAFTKLFGQGAIYSITPISKQAATHAARRLRCRPVTIYVPPLPSDRQISGHIEGQL